jgi:chromosome partition protein MukF
LPELQSTLTELAQSQVGLQLTPVDLCFVVALRARADHSATTAFEEEALVDVFTQVLALVEPQSESPRLRATSAIRRLREQRLLTRIDGAGLVRAGEFALTRLADALAEFFLAEETLTRESLAVLTQTLTVQLTDIRSAAQKGRLDHDAWRQKVVQPLRITAGDLLGGIERRQRGLDLSQEHVRGKIAALLREDWFSAIEACESLLEETAATLRELNDILLRDTATLQSLLQDIGEAAISAGAPEEVGVTRATLTLGEQVDRVAAWGASRQRAWSDYYRYVQRFLRDVVRLDPGRALSQRLREQLRHYLPEAATADDTRPTGGSFTFVCSDDMPLPLLRVPDMRAERPAVTRPVAEHERPLEEVVADVTPIEIDKKTRELLGRHPGGLAEVVRDVVALLPPDERYRSVGRVAAICAADTRITRVHERPWVVAGPVGESHSLVVEEWRFDWDKPLKKRKEKA